MLEEVGTWKVWGAVATVGVGPGGEMEVGQERMVRLLGDCGGTLGRWWNQWETVSPPLRGAGTNRR